MNRRTFLLLSLAVFGSATAAQAQGAAHTVQVEPLGETHGADLGEYVNQVASILGQRWSAAMGGRGKGGQPVLTFTVGADGKASDLRIVGASGNVEVDRAAWNAVSSAALPAPPAGAHGSLAMRATFL